MIGLLPLSCTGLNSLADHRDFVLTLIFVLTLRYILLGSLQPIFQGSVFGSQESHNLITSQTSIVSKRGNAYGRSHYRRVAHAVSLVI